MLRWGSACCLLQVFQLAVLFVAGKTADLVVVVYEYHVRRMLRVGELFGSHLAVVHDDHLVTYGNQVGSCAIQADYATARLAGNNIGFKTIAVVAMEITSSYSWMPAASISSESMVMGPM